MGDQGFQPFLQQQDNALAASRKLPPSLFDSDYTDKSSCAMTSMCGNNVHSREQKEREEFYSEYRQSEEYSQTHRHHQHLCNNGRSKDKLWTSRINSSPMSLPNVPNVLYRSNSVSTSTDGFTGRQRETNSATRVKSSMIDIPVHQSVGSMRSRAAGPSVDAGNTVRRFSGQSTTNYQRTSIPLCPDNSRHTRSFCQSLPCLNASLPGRTGHWPSNVTSITTRSIIRQPSSRLCSISESEVFERDISQQKKHSQRQFTTRHGHYLQNAHSPLHVNNGDQHGVYAVIDQPGDYSHRRESSYPCRRQSEEPTHPSWSQNLDTRRRRFQSWIEEQQFNNNRSVRTEHRGDQHTRMDRLAAPTERSRRSSETVKAANGHHYRVELDLRDNIVKLTHATDEIEDQLLRLIYIPSTIDQLSKLVEELACLQTRARFDSILADKLVAASDNLISRQYQHSIGWNEIIEDIKRAIRSWDDILNEVEIRHRLASNILRITRKCDVMLSIEEAWLNGVMQEEKRIRDSMNAGGEMDFACIQSLQELRNELGSHLPRMEAITDMCAELSGITDAYRSRSEQRLKSFVPPPISKLFEPAQISGQPTSTSSLIRERANRLHRNYGEVDISCRTLINQLTSLLKATKFSTTMLQQQPPVSSGAMYAQVTTGQHPRGGEPAVYDMTEDALQLNDNIRKLDQVKISTVESERPKRASSHGVERLCIDEDRICWMAEQNIFFDPVKGCLCSLNDLIADRRLRFVTRSDDPSATENGLTMANCFVFSEGNLAVAKFAHCCPTKLADVLSSKEGFYDHTKDCKISLLEAIISNILSLRDGRFFNGGTNDCVTLKSALQCGIIDQTGLSTIRKALDIIESSLSCSAKLLSQYRAFFTDDSQSTENFLSLADLALSIEDYASLGLVDDKGYLIHPNTGTSISLIDAIDKKILDPYIKQIHVGGDSPKLSLTEAICQGLIETGHRPKVAHNGRYYNLNEAINAGYVIKPLSLGEAYARGLVNVDGKILDKVEGRRLNLVDAIAIGIIDSQCTCMVHPVNKTPLSIGDAISSKLISRDGRFYSSTSNSWIPLSEAIRSNELNLIVMTPTMRGAVVHDKLQNRMISISEAIGPYPGRDDKRPTNIMIDVSKYAYIDNQSNRQIPIDQAIDISGLILPSFRKYLGKVIVSHDDSEWAKLINGKTVEQCLIRGYIRLYEDTLCFVGAPHRVLNRREPTLYLLRGDENLSMTFISIKDAVRCDLITHTDAILIREMQGCITRDAYILAYLDAKANGLSQITTSLTYSNEEALQVSGEMSTDRTSDNATTSITRPCKNSFQFSSSTDADSNVHALDNEHKFRYSSNEQDERQSRYKVSHEDWSTTGRSRDTIGGNFIFRIPTCISDGFDSVKILSSEKERRRRQLRTKADLDYHQVKGDVAADDRQTRNVQIRNCLSKDVSDVAPEKTYYCDDSEQSQRIKHQHDKCNRDAELRVEQKRSQQQYFPAAAAWNRGSTVVVAADNLTQHKASFSSVEESENLVTDEDAFSSFRAPATSAVASATTITAGKAVNKSDFSVTRSAEFAAGIAKQKSHEAPQERVCRSPSIRKPSPPPRASLSPAFRYLHMNFIDAVNIQLLNIDTGVFKHPHAPARHISIREALDEKLINPCTAFVIDPIQCDDQDAGGPFFPEDHKTLQPSRLQQCSFTVCDRAHEKEISSKTSDRSYNLQEAVDRGLITEDNRVVNRKAAGATISIAEAMKTGLMRLADSSFSYYNIISKTESLSIKSVKDTKANVYIDPNKAIKLNILDLHKGAYFDRANNRRRYSIEEAIQVGFILVENLSNRDAISQAGSMSDRRAASSKSEPDTREEAGHVVNMPSDHLVSTSLIRETRSYNLVGVIDALSGESLTVQQAIDSNILDYIDGRYYDRKREMWIPIIKAIYEHLIQVTRVPVTDHVDKNKRAVSETRTYALKEVRNTKTGELIGIRRAIEEGIIDQHTGLYYDLARNVAMPISLAVERNLILTEENELERHRQVPSAGPTFLRRDVKYLSIEGVIDPKTRQMLSVDDAIAKRVLDTRTCSFYSMVDKALISITDAYTRGYLIGKYISEDEMLNERNTIIARICREERSYLVNSVLDTENQKKLSLNEAITRGLFNADRAVYINPITSEESSLADAIINGFVDAHLVDGSRPVRTARHRASTTKVIRVQKRPVASLSSDQDLSDVYKLDTLEEYVETMHRSDLNSAKQYQVKSDFDGESDTKKAFSTCVSHSTSHIVRRKEKNTKERDIVIQPESETVPTPAIPKDSRRTEEELIIEESQAGGERVINVTNTPSFSSRPIVIEDSRPLHPVSHVVVVDDESTLGHVSHHTYVSKEGYASDKVQLNDSPPINLGVLVPIREASPKKIQTSTIRITTKHEGKPTPVTSEQRQQTTKESRFCKDVEIERSFVDQPLFHRTRESSQTTKGYDGFDVVDTGSTITKHKFIQEILDKAKTYRSSIPDTGASHRKSHMDHQCTYVLQGMVHTLSWVLDPNNGQKISLDEGIERGIFTTKDMTYHDSIQKKDYDTERAVRLGLIGTNEDCSSVIITVDGITYTIHWVLDPIIKHRILPHRAIERGVLDIAKLRYFNPQNSVSISIHEAVKMKFIGAEEKRPEADEICVTTDNCTVVFSWVLDTIAQKHISAYDALKRGLVDVAAGVYFKQNTGDILTLWDALQSGFIGAGEGYPDVFAHDNKADSVASLDEDELTISTKTATYVITGVIHPLTQQELSVSEAIEQGILDKNTGAYRNTNTNSVYELCDAINNGLMYATIIESKESTEMETSSTKNVIQRFIINKVIDPRDGKIISGLQAQADGILNYRQGMYSDPDTNRGISIKEAIDKTLIEVELINQTSDEQFELDLIRDSLLERRITTFSIFNVIDPIIEQNISAQEAVNRGILDTDTKTYFDAGTGKYYELCDALSRGFLQADVKERVIRKPLGLSLQNASRLGFYNYDIGKFKDPGTDQIFSLKDAIDKGHININGPAIACVNNSPLLLKDAFHLRLISRTTGVLDRVRLEQLKGKVTNSRIFRINIEDAVRCGLLNLHTGLYKHVHTGEQLTLKGAIERGLLDGDSMIMEHPVNNKFVTLTEALGNLMIDTNGNITDLRGQCPPSTLEMEFNQRRLFSAFNVNTGELFLQRPSEMVAFEKYVQKSGSSSDLAKVIILSFQTDKEYNILGAIEHGMLDADSGKFFDFEHKDQMSVREAIRKGFISIIGSPVVPFKADHDTLAVRVTSRKRRLSSRTRSGGAHSVVYSPGQTKSSHSRPGNASPDRSGVEHISVEGVSLDNTSDSLQTHREENSVGTHDISVSAGSYNTNAGMDSNTYDRQNINTMDSLDQLYPDCSRSTRRCSNTYSTHRERLRSLNDNIRSLPYILGRISGNPCEFVSDHGKSTLNRISSTGCLFPIRRSAVCMRCRRISQDYQYLVVSEKAESVPLEFTQQTEGFTVNAAPSSGTVKKETAKTSSHLHPVASQSSLNVTSAFDSLSGMRLPIEKAMEVGIFDQCTGVFVDRRSKAFLTTSEAQSAGLITVVSRPTPANNSMDVDNSVVESSSLSSATASSKCHTKRRAYIIGVKNPITNRYNSVKQAVDDGILNYLTGKFKIVDTSYLQLCGSIETEVGNEIDLRQADALGFLQVLEVDDDVDPSSMTVNRGSSSIPCLSTAPRDEGWSSRLPFLTCENIDEVYDGMTGKLVKPNVAVSLGLIEDRGFYVDRNTQLRITFNTAIRAGLITIKRTNETSQQENDNMEREVSKSMVISECVGPANAASNSRSSTVKKIISGDARQSQGNPTHQFSPSSPSIGSATAENQLERVSKPSKRENISIGTSRHSLERLNKRSLRSITEQDTVGSMSGLRNAQRKQGLFTRLKEKLARRSIVEPNHPDDEFICWMFCLDKKNNENIPVSSCIDMYSRLFDADTGRLYSLIPALQQGLIFLAHPDYPHVKKDYVLSESCKNVLIVDWVSPSIIDGKLSARRKKKITLSKAIDSGFIQVCNGCVHIRSNESVNKYFEVDFQDAIDRGTIKGRVFDVPQWMVDNNHYPECEDRVSDIYEELMSTKGKAHESSTTIVNTFDKPDSACTGIPDSLDIHQDTSNECDLGGESEISNADTLKPWRSDMNTGMYGQTMGQSECEPTLTSWKHSLGSKQDIGKSNVEPDSLMSMPETSDTQAVSRLSTCAPDDGSVVGSETINDNQLDSLVNIESFDIPLKGEQIIAYHSINTEDEKDKSVNLSYISKEKPMTRNSKQETVDLNRQLNQLYREIANLSKKVVTIGVSDIEDLEQRLDLVQEAESQVTQLERSSNALLAKYRQLFIAEQPVAENGWISAYNENIDTPVKSLKEEIFARLDVMRHANEHMKQFLQNSSSIDCACTELEHELATVAEEQLLLDETHAACKRIEETMLKFNAKQEALESLDYSVRCVAEDLRTVADRANMFAQTQRDLQNFKPFTYPDISILSNLEAKIRVRYHDIKRQSSRLSHLLQDISLKHLEYLANANRLLEVFDVVENELTELVNRDLGPDLEMTGRLDLLQQSLSETAVFQKRIESYSDQLLSLEQSCTSLVDMLNSCTNIVPHQIASELRDQVTCISARYGELQSKVTKHAEHLQGQCKAAIVSERCCQTANKYMSLIQLELSDLHSKDNFNFDDPDWLVDTDESSLSRLLSHLREQGFVYREFIDRMNFHLRSLSSVWSVDDEELPRDLQVEQDVLSRVQVLSQHIKDIVYDTEARQASTDRSANMLMLMQGPSSNARRLVKQCDEWWSSIRETDSPVVERLRMPHDKRSTLSQFLSYACKAYYLPLDCSQSSAVNLKSLRSSTDQLYKLVQVESTKVEAFRIDLSAQQTQAPLSYHEKLQSYLDREREMLLHYIHKFSSLTESINGYIDQKTNAVAILTNIVERLSHVSAALRQTSVITYSIRLCEEEFERCQDLSGELNTCSSLAVDLHQLIVVLSTARTSIFKLLGIECGSCSFHVGDLDHNAEQNACIEDFNIERMIPPRINEVMTAVVERRQEIEKNLHDIREHTENVKSAWTALLHFQRLADDLESKGRTDYSMLSIDNQKMLEASYSDLHRRLDDESAIMQDVRSTIMQLGIPIHSTDLALPKFSNQEVKSMVDEVNDIEFKWATLSESIADRVINIQNHLDDLQTFEDDQCKLAEELAQTENLIYLATISSAIGAETMAVTVDKLNLSLEEHRDRQRKLKEFGILVERMAHKLEQSGHDSSNHDVASSLADAQTLRMKFCQMNTYWVDLETQLSETVQRFEAAGEVSKKVNVELDSASELLDDIEKQLKQLAVCQKEHSTLSCTDASLQLETLNQKAKQIDHIISSCSSVLSSYRHQRDTDSKHVHLADDLENEIHRIKSQLRKVRILLESCELEVSQRKKHAPNGSPRLDEVDKSDWQGVTANFKRELDLLSFIGLITDLEELNSRITKLQELGRRIDEASENATLEENDNAELISLIKELSFECKQSVAWFIDCKPVIEQISEDQKSVMDALEEIDKELQLLITCDSGSELHATGDDLVLWFDSIRTRFVQTHTDPKMVDALKDKLQLQDGIPPQWIVQNAEFIESRWTSINAKIQKIASANKNISSPMHSQTQDESTDRSVSLKTDTYEPRRLQKILTEVLTRGFDLQCEIDKVQNNLNKETTTFVEHSESVNDFRKECNLLSFQAFKLYSQLTDAVDIGELDALVVAIKADVEDLLSRTDNKDFRVKQQLLGEISTMSTELDSAVTQVQRLIVRNLSFPIYPDKLRSHETELKRALDDALKVENSIDFVRARLTTLSEGTKGQVELSDNSTVFNGLENRIQYFSDSIMSSKTWLIQRLDQVQLVAKPLERFWSMVDSNEDVLKSMDVKIIDLAKHAVVDILDEHFSPTVCSDQIHVFEDIERELTEALNISEIDEILSMLCEVDFEIEDKDDLKDRATQISKWASCLTDDICEFRDRLVIALYRFCTLTRKLRERVSWARATEDDVDALSTSSAPLVDQLRTLYEYRELLEQKAAELDINQHVVSDQDMGSWLGTLSSVGLESLNLFEEAEDDALTVLQMWEAFDSQRQTLMVKLSSSIDASEQTLMSRKSVDFILEHIHGWLDFALMRTRDLDASSALTSNIKSNTRQSVLRREQTLNNLQESPCGQDSIVKSKICEARRLVCQLSELLGNGVVTEPFSKEQSNTTLGTGGSEENIEKQLQTLSNCIDLMEHDFSRYVEIGGLPSTIIPQLNSIADTSMRMENIQAITNRLKAMIEHSDRFYKQRFNVICERWKLIQGKMTARKTRMETCADEVIEFDNGMKKFLKSLGDFERQMPAMKIRTRGFDQLQSLAERYQEFEDLLNNAQANFLLLDKLGTKIRFKCRSGDSVILKNLLLSTSNRWTKLMNRWNERTRELHRVIIESTKFEEDCADLDQWLDKALTQLKGDTIHAAEAGMDGDLISAIEDSSDELASMVERCRQTFREIECRRYNFDEIYRQCLRFSDACSQVSAEERARFRERASLISAKWRSINTLANERRKAIDSLMLIQGKVVELARSSVNWLNQVERLLTSTEGQCFGDLGTVQGLCDRYQFICSEFMSREEQLQLLLRRENKHLSEDTVRRLSSCWDRVKTALDQRGKELSESLDLATVFEQEVTDFFDWSDKMEKQLSSKNGGELYLSGDILWLSEKASLFSEWLDEIMAREESIGKIKRYAEKILSACHSTCVERISQCVVIAETRMSVILNAVNAKEDQMKQSLERMVRYDNSLSDIINRLAIIERGQCELDKRGNELLVDLSHIPQVLNGNADDEGGTEMMNSAQIECVVEDAQNMLIEAEYFLAEVQNVDVLLDKLLCAHCPTKLRQHSKLRTRLFSEKQSTSSGNRSTYFRSQQSLLNKTDNSSRSCLGSHTDQSQMEDQSMDMASNSSRNAVSKEQADNEASSSTSMATTDLSSCLLNDQRLRDALQRLDKSRSEALFRVDSIRTYISRLKELLAIRSFDFDLWCERFKSFIGENREKLMTWFSRVDYKRSGQVDKQDFIQTLLKSKFATSRIEVEMVADIFDRNDNGRINYKDFISTFDAGCEIRRHRVSGDQEKIHQEVKDQCGRCRCMDRYNVQQVAEGRYRFGNAKRYRLVRILRSTVMVRVGGGWVSLAEFLSKNDPCRVQGKTNLELRDQLLSTSRELAGSQHQLLHPLRNELGIGSKSATSTPVSRCKFPSHYQRNASQSPTPHQLRSRQNTPVFQTNSTESVLARAHYLSSPQIYQTSRQAAERSSATDSSTALDSERSKSSVARNHKEGSLNCHSLCPPVLSMISENTAIAQFTPPVSKAMHQASNRRRTDADPSSVSASRLPIIAKRALPYSQRCTTSDAQSTRSSQDIPGKSWPPLRSLTQPISSSATNLSSPYKMSSSTTSLAQGRQAGTSLSLLPRVSVTQYKRCLSNQSPQQTASSDERTNRLSHGRRNASQSDSADGRNKLQASNPLSANNIKPNEQASPGSVSEVNHSSESVNGLEQISKAMKPPSPAKAFTSTRDD